MLESHVEIVPHRITSHPLAWLPSLFTVEICPIVKSRGGIAAASVLARAAGGRAPLPRLVLTLSRCNGKVSMLPGDAKGKMLLSPRTHQFAEGSVHVLRVDFGVFAETEL